MISLTKKYFLFNRYSNVVFYFHHFGNWFLVIDPSSLKAHWWSFFNFQWFTQVGVKVGLPGLNWGFKPLDHPDSLILFHSIKSKKLPIRFLMFCLEGEIFKFKVLYLRLQ